MPASRFSLLDIVAVTNTSAQQQQEEGHWWMIQFKIIDIPASNAADRALALANELQAKVESQDPSLQAQGLNIQNLEVQLPSVTTATTTTATSGSASGDTTTVPASSFPLGRPPGLHTPRLYEPIEPATGIAGKQKNILLLACLLSCLLACLSTHHYFSSVGHHSSWIVRQSDDFHMVLNKEKAQYNGRVSDTELLLCCFVWPTTLFYLS